MTRADVEARLTEFANRLATQQSERDKAQAIVDRMSVAIYQLQGAVSALRELVASESEEPPA